MEIFDQNFDFATRLLAAVLLGSLLGLERSIAGKMAGMRTYGLISLGAALFVVTSQVITERFIGLTMFDPLRVASQVVVGIGFVGAGLIIFREKESRLSGLTTAAGLWVSAAIGVASGFALYGIATAATVFALIIFTLFWYLERYLERAIARLKNTPGYWEGDHAD